MKFGLCGSLAQAEIAQNAGFDYLEAGLTSLLGDEDDAAFAPVLAQYQALDIPVTAFNLFLPRDLKVVGSEVDEARMAAYVGRALSRAKQIGAKTVVFGSGGARNVPDGFSRDKAVAQIVHFLTLVADVAEEVGLIIAIEPLIFMNFLRLASKN